jgi:hypothetical protein
MWANQKMKFETFIFKDDVKCLHVVVQRTHKVIVVATLTSGSRPRLATKARAYKNAGQEGSPGVTFHVLGSAKECEGMNPYTPKGTPTLGIGIPVDPRIFREQLQGTKFIGLRHSLYHWKALRT